MKFKLPALKPREGYDSLLSFVDFVVSRTSDSLADILTKALPLLAPLPNAVSLFYITQEALHYNALQAFAVAAALEGMFFALTEVVLKLWDSAHDDARHWPFFWASVISYGVYFILVMFLVWTLETVSMAVLAFPMVSVVAAVVLGCARWHRRMVERGANHAHTELDQIRSEFDKVSVELNVVRLQFDEIQRALDNSQTESNRLRAELNRARKELDGADVLSELSEAQREKLDELQRIVSTVRITGPADVVDHGMSKSHAYAIWPVAVAGRMIYKNGDGAYHARKEN